MATKSKSLPPLSCPVIPCYTHNNNYLPECDPAGTGKRQFPYFNFHTPITPLFLLSCTFSLAVGMLPGPTSLHDVPEITDRLQLPHKPPTLPLPPPGDNLSAVINAGFPDTFKREPFITIGACFPRFQAGW